MGKKLKFGIVGTGNIFQIQHVKPLMEHPEAEIIAVCDTNLEKAKKVAREWDIPHVYSDYRDMLRDCGELDAIDICTPNLFHSDIAVAGLHAGKHVFCEKPDAVSPEEAERMAAAAKETGKLLMCMRNNRFTPAAAYMKRFIGEGKMGDIYTGRCGWIRRRGIPGKGGWFTSKQLSGGGPLIDLGVHFIDLAVWLMGNPRPVSVSGATYSKFGDNELSDSIDSRFGEKQKDGTYDVEDLATGFIRFDNGATLQIEFSWASNIEEGMNFVELRGTKSGCSYKNGDLRIYSEDAGQLVNVMPLLETRSEKSGHALNLEHFIDCIQHQADPIVTPQQGVDIITIISAIYESAETGREVRL